MVNQKTFQITTRGRGTVELTGEVSALVRDSGIRDGLCHVFVQHTSASLMLCENADPAVRADLESFMARIAPDGDPLFHHDAEGSDDMPAHVRSVLTGSSLTVPVRDAGCVLGTWQGIYLWEHRRRGFSRRVTVTVIGE